MIWTLRYKKPQGVAIVQIETARDSEDDARALGQRLVESMPGPAYRYISVERWLVATDIAADEPATVSKPNGKASQGQRVGA